MDKIYQWLKKSVSVSAINVIAEGVTCVIPKPTTYVIPEGRSRESHRCETAKRLRPPAKALGGDGICAKRLGLRAKPLGNDGARKRMLCAGFTLIELLVVVLIIGILTAVALPQYRLAVQKTRTLSLMPLLRSVSDAENIYFMENGAYTLSLSDLSIDMPAGGELSSAGNEMRYNNFYCFLRRDGKAGTYSAYCNDTSPGAPSLEKYFSSQKFICWGDTDVSALSSRVCRSISGRTEANATAGLAKKGYTFQ